MGLPPLDFMQNAPSVVAWFRILGAFPVACNQSFDAPTMRLPVNVDDRPAIFFFASHPPSLGEPLCPHRDLQSALPVRRVSSRDRDELQSPDASSRRMRSSGVYWSPVLEDHRFSLPMGLLRNVLHSVPTDKHIFELLQLLDLSLETGYVDTLVSVK
jgi:hypothetical protein